MGDGTRFGIKLSYAEQPSPDGLAQAFIIGKDFIGDDACALVLGDNIFYGNGLGKKLKDSVSNAENNARATVFGYYVSDPERFGVVDFDENGKVTSIEEKPSEPRSNYAVTGIYFYPAGVSSYAERIKPSGRGEYEITSLNQMYLEEGLLDMQHLDRGFVWLDAGTINSLMEASCFIQTVQNQNGIIISAPEEIAYLYKWIDKETLLKTAELYGNSSYGKHLKEVTRNRLRK